MAGKRNWISVEDELPKKGQTVLSYAPRYMPKKLDCMVVSSYENGQFMTERDCGCRVTYWMPLPEPPKRTARASEKGDA